MQKWYDFLLYFESFLSIISDWNPTNIVGYYRKVESMSNINISYKELKQLEEGSYQLLDMRDETNTSYWIIPGAVVAADEEELAAQAKEYLDQGKKVILYTPTHRKEGKVVFPLEEHFDFKVLNDWCIQNYILFVIRRHFLS